MERRGTTQIALRAFHDYRVHAPNPDVWAHFYCVPQHSSFFGFLRPCKTECENSQFLGLFKYHTLREQKNTRTMTKTPTLHSTVATSLVCSDQNTVAVPTHMKGLSLCYRCIPIGKQDNCIFVDRGLDISLTVFLTILLQPRPIQREQRYLFAF